MAIAKAITHEHAAHQRPRLDAHQLACAVTRITLVTVCLPVHSSQPVISVVNRAKPGAVKQGCREANSPTKESGSIAVRAFSGGLLLVCRNFDTDPLKGARLSFCHPALLKSHEATTQNGMVAPSKTAKVEPRELNT